MFDRMVNLLEILVESLKRKSSRRVCVHFLWLGAHLEKVQIDFQCTCRGHFTDGVHGQLRRANIDGIHAESRCQNRAHC